MIMLKGIIHFFISKSFRTFVSYGFVRC